MQDMEQKKYHYSNEDITIHWQPTLCTHSAVCIKGLGKVFDSRRRPWVDMTKGSTEAIMAQIKQCPSGALSFVMNEKEDKPVVGPLPQVKENVQMPTIECLKDGPYLIREMITIKLPDGTEETRVGTTALCRCGASKNKPYCDGGHRAIGFEG